MAHRAIKSTPPVRVEPETIEIVEEVKVETPIQEEATITTDSLEEYIQAELEEEIEQGIQDELDLKTEETIKSESKKTSKTTTRKSRGN